MDANRVQLLNDIANRLRINSIKGTTAANSGHPTSCASASEIMSVLFFDIMKYKADQPRNPNNDRFVLSKGHAAPVLYAAWLEVGFLTEADILNLRKITSDIEGHPTPRLEFVDVATGSLGQGLSCAAGMAYTGKHFDKSDYRVYCLIGDGESAEGSIWEALAFSSFYKLDNLVAIFDINRLGQSDPTALQHDVHVYKARVEAFGCHAIVVDGHDVTQLSAALNEAMTVKNKPTVIIAKTFKGHGMMPDIENQLDWHGKPLGNKSDAVIAFIESKIVHKQAGPLLRPKEPSNTLKDIGKLKVSLSSPPNYKLGEQVATRLAYGTALKKLGETCDRVVALDADTKNSTFSIKFKEAFPERFVECFIAEQNMVGVSIGCAARRRCITFTSAFACFFTRAFDQLRMGAISQTNCNFSGSHVGISIGEDGPSQMGLEDIAMFRSIPLSTVFYPSDAVSTERAVELAANTDNICFIRTGRPNAPVIYANDQLFEVGRAHILRENVEDKVTIIGAGVTLTEALKAADILCKEFGIHVRVVDPFTVKPLDGKLICDCVSFTGGRVVTVEDHYYEGGLGEAVLSSLAECSKLASGGYKVKRLAVGGVARSGKSEELMAMFGIDAKAIIKAVKELLA